MSELPSFLQSAPTVLGSLPEKPDRPPIRLGLAGACVLLGLWAMASALPAPPALAFDLIARHQVTAQFATPQGKPMADAEVRVFAPGKSKTPVITGRTDANGKFAFAADRDGFWTAEAVTKREVARVMIRVGGQTASTNRLSTLLVLGLLAGLVVIAGWYRFSRPRPHPKP